MTDAFAGLPVPSDPRAVAAIGLLSSARALAAEGLMPERELALLTDIVAAEIDEAVEGEARDGETPRL